MSEPVLDRIEAGRVAANARMYKPDPQLDQIADLYEGDREKWDRLPSRLRDLSLLHKDMRDVYRRAVDAGLTPADPGDVLSQVAR